jgi:hypothetical protein
MTWRLAAIVSSITNSVGMIGPSAGRIVVKLSWDVSVLLLSPFSNWDSGCVVSIERLSIAANMVRESAANQPGITERTMRSGGGKVGADVLCQA